jgi:hypothetical protein
MVVRAACCCYTRERWRVCMRMYVWEDVGGGVSRDKGRVGQDRIIK